MRIIAYIFWTIIILLAISFATLNSHSVIVNYYFGKINIYLPLLMLIELVIGAILGMIAMLPTIFKQKSKNRQSKSRIKAIEQELNNLRVMPIKDEH